MNYNFTMGFKNVVHFTTGNLNSLRFLPIINTNKFQANILNVLVPVKKNTTTFELTENETKLVKLTWEIECDASYMYPVPVTITNNG